MTRRPIGTDRIFAAVDSAQSGSVGSVAPAGYVVPSQKIRISKRIRRKKWTACKQLITATLEQDLQFHRFVSTSAPQRREVLDVEIGNLRIAIVANLGGIQRGEAAAA
ncbi:hypothetical protein [Burkholderia thailandensis]|uniref:hypothetical protein n=1 Tax=Burkholderia thailandensis TaxID=57975 RepID=UPI0021651888|nr:hypothetical protein [Burkholderia thailandensis]MCS3398457.1 hypothetical protein [Burkholderia thailandensis]